MSAPDHPPRSGTPAAVTFDEAVLVIEALARPRGMERRPLEAAGGHVLAEVIRAAVDSPQMPVSAMDGYAVRDADLSPDRSPFRIVGEAFAGAPCQQPVAPGECVRIFTGAPMPIGADRVVIQEEVTRDGTTAWMALPSGGPHVRARGSDFRSGEALLPIGRVLDPLALVAAAAADRGEVTVWRRPRVAIIATGDELAPAGAATSRTCAIPDSVSPGVAALVAAWGGEVVHRAQVRDDLAALKNAAAAAFEAADLVVTIGGASVGERDHARTMFADAGLISIFPKVAMRPGKPVWLGHVGPKLVMGLPGNPTSAMVTARLLLAPLVAGLSGRRPGSALEWQQLPLGTVLDSGGPFETFPRAREQGGRIHPLADQASSAQRALAEATLLIRRPAHVAAAPVGAAVPVLRI